MEFAPLRLAGMRQRSGRRPRTLTLDVDGLPQQVHGEQAGSAYNGYVRTRMRYPLIAPCAETGDMLAGLLRAGNAGAAAQPVEETTYQARPWTRARRLLIVIKEDPSQ